MLMVIPRKWTSGQGFRPQPMGLCLNGHPANPVHCLFQRPGPDRIPTVLRLRPPASSLGPAFIVKGDRASENPLFCLLDFSPTP